MRSGLSIVLPCLNEKNTIAKAVFFAYKHIKNINLKRFEIIVADNGSTDGTLLILKKLKNIFKKIPLKILNVPIKGYGSALHHGITSASYDYVLFADSDLSYQFCDLPKFTKKIKTEPDLVLGSRFKGKIFKNSMPILHRYLGTPVLTLLVNFLYNFNTSDCNSGMRMVKKDFYQRLNMKNAGMEWASELLVKTAKMKGRYSEVPITLKKDQRGRSPHLNSWVDGWRHLKVIILLRPEIFAFFSVIFLSLSMRGFLNQNVSFYFYLLISEFFFFSLVALKKLESAISKTDNLISNLTNKLPLVAFGILLNLVVLVLLFTHFINYDIKIILLFQALFFNIWLFFIETINTHMLNSLR